MNFEEAIFAKSDQHLRHNFFKMVFFQQRSEEHTMARWPIQINPEMTGKTLREQEEAAQ